MLLIFMFLQVNTVDSLKKMMDEEYSHMNFISVPMEEIYSPEFLNNSGFSNTLEAAGGSDDYGTVTIYCVCEAAVVANVHVQNIL